MSRLKTPLIVQILVFLIPLNIYVIGNRWGTGIQWALFQYQHTVLGNSLNLVSDNIIIVLTGIIASERTAISLSLWVVGVLLFSIATIILILANIEGEISLVRKASLFTITGGLVLLISLIFQYGIGLNGPSGFAIPVGIPVVLIIGWWMYLFPDEDAIIEDADEDGPNDSKSNVSE
jgi:hypothetical protein